MADISYARAGDTHIAYQVIGEPGPLDVVVMAGALFPFEMLAEDRVCARFTSGLASLGRLTIFDKRGVGYSDPITDWSRPIQEQWAEDLLTVVAAAELDRPVVVSWDHLGPARFAVSVDPGAFRSMILINPSHSTESYVQRFNEFGAGSLPTHSVEATTFPSRIDDAEFRSWLSQAGRSGASPASASRIWEHLLACPGDLTPAGISTRALVLHSRDCVQREPEVRSVADALLNATFVQVAGRDTFPIAGDVDLLTTEIAEFVTGAPSQLAPQRSMAAILFTDLVGSTDRAASEGDAHWRELLDAHDRTVQRSVRHSGGRVVKFTGDGVLALLPSATNALEAASAIIYELSEQGLSVRVGVHAGDVDVRGDDVSGLAVNVAARVMSHAGAGETLVSDPVRLATLGCGHRFDDLGEHVLKGVPGTWSLHRFAGIR